MRKSSLEWQLSEVDRVNILIDWCKATQTYPDLLEKEFYKQLGMIDN
jgi:hypothetical protein